MTRSLSEFVSETTKSYEPARQAIQNQLDAISGQLAETEANINKQFAVQQQNLDNQRQTAASNASMQAAGSGGSFGGKANIANRNYYRDTFVPAVTQLQTNQAQALSEARQRSDNNRLSLQSQLANLMTQANTSALSRYDNWSQFDQNMAWDKDKFGQQLAWEKDQFNQNMAWDKEKWAQQLAENEKSRAASRAASAAQTSSLQGYLNQVLAGQKQGNSSSYYKNEQTAKPAYVLDAKGKAVYNFGSGQGGTPSLQSLLATDPKVMAQIIANRNKK